MILHDSVQERDTGLSGEVLTPGQDGYDEAATTLFAAGTPEMVVRPRDAAEVAAALRHTARAGLTGPDGCGMVTANTVYQNQVMGLYVYDSAPGTYLATVATP